jgi:hypothetical protein
MSDFHFPSKKAVALSVSSTVEHTISPRMMLYNAAGTEKLVVCFHNLLTNNDNSQQLSS